LIKKHKIINADIFAALNSLNDNSIDVAITSPPYWAQRDYGFDKQIGSEPTYIEFISRLTFLFDILKTKLSKKGVFYLNIGDKYLKKYGKTPLGLIPYKLAYFMQKNGWIINDIIIWYKPNHMPSSVKNRFVNSYEPVFILSKNNDNYFTDFAKECPNYHNIININLQPTPYKHVAAYPEKLVSKLLDFTKICKDYTVLDPFAGSGTTLKVINERNNSLFCKNHAKGIMIEFNEEYVDIIKERTEIPNINVFKFPFTDYNYPLLEENSTVNFEKYEVLKNIKTKTICESKSQFYSILKTIQTERFIKDFPKEEPLFVGLKEFSVKDIYNISFIKNWVIRNNLVVRNNKWYPVFLLVHDNKTYRYKFNYKSLQLNHKLQKEQNFQNKNYIGYQVVDSLLKEKREGIITDIISKHKNNLPEYVKVLWKDGSITKEYVINDKEEINNNIKRYKLNGYTTIKEIKEFVSLNKIIDRETINPLKNYCNGNGKNYNGKFKEIERKNWGASPGARSSVEEEYFSVQRLYEVDQNLIADYLNYIRKQKGFSKIKFTELFPKNYIHTVGHWLRKDFGGSIPVLEDWEKIEKYFKIDQKIKKYACTTALRLQTVTKTKYKIPDDVISIELLERLNDLKKKRV